MIRLADLQIDLDKRCVSRNGAVLAIKPRSFQLLRFLLERYPAIASQREIMAGVWPGIVVSADALTQRVRLLRRQLGNGRAAEQYIATVHGLGYRLAVAPCLADASGVVANPPRAFQWRALSRPVMTAALGAILALGVAAGALLYHDSTPHALKHALKHRALGEIH
jgi:DNA-binding winged helix-turn-helix (wHTH) protein